MIRDPHSRELLGYERSVVIEEHLAALAAPQLEDVRDGDSPIARWARANSRQLALTRARRSKRRPARFDDAPKLVDEVN